MSDFQLRRLGLVMQPEPGNPLEAEGVLNPPPFVALMVSFTSSRGLSRGATTPVSV